jgi:hypothetical protein
MRCKIPGEASRQEGGVAVELTSRFQQMLTTNVLGVFWRHEVPETAGVVAGHP